MVRFCDSLELSKTIGRAFIDPALNTLYGSSDIILTYSSSGKAVSVSVLTLPLDAVAKIIFATTSGFGASKITIRSYRPIVR